MANADDDDKLRFGINYDLDRYTFGDTDEHGHLIWHHDIPKNKDWDRITMVTINYGIEAGGEKEENFRNIKIHPDRPLDPYGSNLPGYRGPHKGGRYGPEFYYDLDDLVTEFWWETDTP